MLNYVATPDAILQWASRAEPLLWWSKKINGLSGSGNFPPSCRLGELIVSRALRAGLSQIVTSCARPSVTLFLLGQSRQKA